MEGEKTPIPCGEQFSTLSNRERNIPYTLDSINRAWFYRSLDQCQLSLAEINPREVYTRIRAIGIGTIESVPEWRLRLAPQWHITCGPDALAYLWIGEDHRWEI